MTLEQRAILFHRQFPEVKITRSQLCRIYDKNGVKRKAVVNTKILTQKQELRLVKPIELLREQLSAAISSNQLIIYIDEVMFTSKSILKREYSARHQNIKVDYNKMYLETTAVVAAITQQEGLLMFKCVGKSINKEKWMEFIKDLRKKIGKRKATLFVDNLSVHHSIVCLNECKAQGFEVIFNAAYSPQFMPIEFVFSQVKRVFKNLKTNQIVNGVRMDTQKLIQQAFKSVKLESVRNSITHCHSNLEI